MTAKEHPIVFFDGTCGMCSWSVRWMLKHDRQASLRFAPLQGETYANLDRDDKPMDLNSMVFAADDRIFVRSAAVVRTLWVIGGAWRMLGGVLWLIPKPIRDAGYRLIATHRHRLMRSGVPCPVPTAEERSRLLP